MTERWQNYLMRNSVGGLLLKNMCYPSLFAWMLNTHTDDITDNRRKAFPQKFTLTVEPVLRIYSNRSPANQTICGRAGDRAGYWDRAGVWNMKLKPNYPWLLLVLLCCTLLLFTSCLMRRHINITLAGNWGNGLRTRTLHQHTHCPPNHGILGRWFRD